MNPRRTPRDPAGDSDPAGADLRLLRELLARDARGGAGESGGVADPVIDRRIRELKRIQRALDQAGAEEREVLDSLPPVEPADADLVRRVLGPRMRAGRSRMSAWRWTLCLAAAAVLCTFAWLRLRPLADDAPAEGESYLSAKFAMTPAGEAGPVYPTFRWDCPRPPGGWFKLSIYRQDGELLIETELEQAEWIPEAEVDLPDRLIWRVSAHDAGGQVTVEDQRAAWRVPR